MTPDLTFHEEEAVGVDFRAASRHSALSYEHAGKIEAQLQAEVAELDSRPVAGGGFEQRRARSGGDHV